MAYKFFKSVKLLFNQLMCLASLPPSDCHSILLNDISNELIPECIQSDGFWQNAAVETSSKGYQSHQGQNLVTFLSQICHTDDLCTLVAITAIYNISRSTQLSTDSFIHPRENNAARFTWNMALSRQIMHHYQIITWIGAWGFCHPTQCSFEAHLGSAIWYHFLKPHPF